MCLAFISKELSATPTIEPAYSGHNPKGDGYAHVLIDYGAEFNLLWVVFLDDSGECWTYDNTQIRAQKNVTMGRTHVSTHRAPGIAEGNS